VLMTGEPLEDLVTAVALAPVNTRGARSRASSYERPLCLGTAALGRSRTHLAGG
jgi:hypothetical protein